MVTVPLKRKLHKPNSELSATFCLEDTYHFLPCLNIEIPPTMQYHCKCRGIFNLKRILDTIIFQEGNTSPQTSK